MRRCRAIVAALLLLLAAPAQGLADEEETTEDATASEGEAEEEDDRTAVATVVVEETVFRSGPSEDFRTIGRARRGEAYPVRDRSTVGHWLKVRRPDGTDAWIVGAAVHVELVDLDADETVPVHRSRVFAPPPLEDAHAEIAIVFGVLARGAYMAVRPTWLVHPTFGIEIGGGISISRAGRLMIATAGGVVNLFPDSAFIPFFTAGGGAAWSNPTADSFVVSAGRVGALYGGGGFRIAFRQRLTLRVEARAYTFFEPNRYVSSEEFSGGLTVFF